MSALLDPDGLEQVPLSERDLPLSTYALLLRGAKAYADRDALVLDGLGRTPEKVTYEDLLHRVTRVANALSKLGVTRRDPVALLGPNGGELLTALLATEAVGIAAPINPMLAPEAIAAMLALGGTRVLIAAGPEISRPLWQLAVHLGERLGLSAVLALRPDGARGERPALGSASVTIGYLQELAGAEPPEFLTVAPPEPDDIAAYFHTGGTTGTPKLAAHTHRNQVFTAWSVAASLTDETTLFGGLPMFHVNAVMVTILAPLVIGVRTVWTGPLGYRDPALFPGFWSLVERWRINTMSAVPTVYKALTRVPVDADISSLKYVITGATAMPLSVRAEFESHTKVPVYDGYGLTEATCVSSRDVPGHARPGSVGIRLPYQRIRAVAPGDRRPLPAGTTGVIEVSGPNVFPGYVTRGPDGAVVLDPLGKVTDGWLDTGDRGHVDADGYLSVTGRLKDVIIRGGHNIDPALVEEAVLSHPAVAAASAVGGPDAHAGEVPVCYAVLAPGATATGAELVAWAAEHSAEPASAPRSVYIVDDLPVTEVGKDFKPALRADAIRRAIVPQLPGHEVEMRIEDGVPVAVVEVGDRHADEVRALLGRYSFRWRPR